VRQLSPKIAGKTVPLPVKGSIALIPPGAIEVVVVAPAVVVLPCPVTGTGGGADVAVDGTTAVDVVALTVVVGASVTVVPSTLDDVATVVGGATVVVGAGVVVVGGATVVVGAGVVVVVGHSSDGGNDAESVESKLRSLFRIVSVTVPLEGAVPVACQICCGPVPFVS